MPYPNSADVASGDTILASDHNNLRSDLLHATLGHAHTGAANGGTVVDHSNLTNVTANQHHSRSHSMNGASDHAAATQGDVPYAGAAGAWSLLGYGTAGRVLTTQGVGANPTWARNGARTITASAALLASLDTERTTASAAYVLVKKFTTNLVGVHRVEFDLRESVGTGDTATARIYKNGVAFGSEQTNVNIVYQTKSEDLSFIAGDTIELWYKLVGAGGGSAQVRNFRCYGVIADIELTTD